MTKMNNIVWTPNKFIAASSALIITLTTITDYFVSRKVNWKSRFIFRTFVIPPMMWAVLELAQTKRDLYLMIMGGLCASITSSLENIPIFFNISFMGSYNTEMNQGNQMIRPLEQAVPVISQQMTQDPSQFATQTHWNIGN